MRTFDDFYVVRANLKKGKIVSKDLMRFNDARVAEMYNALLLVVSLYEFGKW